MALWAFANKADQAVVAGPLGGTTQTLAYGANAVAGDLLLVIVSWDTNLTISSVVDNASPSINTYTALSPRISSGTHFLQLWYKLSANAGTTPTATVTFSGTGATNVQISWAQYTPPANSSVATALDVSTSGTGNSTTAASGLTTANQDANELAIGYAGSQSLTWTAGTGYTLRTTSLARGNAIEDNLQPGFSTGGIQSTFTLGTSGTWSCGVAIFLPGSISSVASSSFQDKVSSRFSPGTDPLGNFTASGGSQIIQV